MSKQVEDKCPTCGHVRRIYTRRLPKADLDTLSQLYGMSQKTGQEWFHISSIKRHRSGCGFAKFRYWDLVEEGNNNDPDKKNSGTWRLTPKGKDFMSGVIRIPSHVQILDAKCIGYAGDKLNVRDAYRIAGFSFAELMAPFR